MGHDSGTRTERVIGHQTSDAALPKNPEKPRSFWASELSAQEPLADTAPMGYERYGDVPGLDLLGKRFYRWARQGGAALKSGIIGFVALVSIFVWSQQGIALEWPLYAVNEPAGVFAAKNIAIIKPPENCGSWPVSRNKPWEYRATTVARLDPIVPVDKFVNWPPFGNIICIAKADSDPMKLSSGLTVIVDADTKIAGWDILIPQISRDDISNLRVVSASPAMFALHFSGTSARNIGALQNLSHFQIAADSEPSDNHQTARKINKPEVGGFALADYRAQARLWWFLGGLIGGGFGMFLIVIGDKQDCQRRWLKQIAQVTGPIIVLSGVIALLLSA